MLFETGTTNYHLADRKAELDAAIAAWHAQCAVGTCDCALTPGGGACIGAGTDCPRDLALRPFALAVIRADFAWQATRHLLASAEYSTASLDWIRNGVNRRPAPKMPKNVRVWIYALRKSLLGDDDGLTQEPRW